MFTPEVLGIACGLTLALGIFAFKTAVGEYYFLAVTPSVRQRLVGILAMQGGYLLLFAGAFFILERFDLFRFAGDSMQFLQAGVWLHVLLCMGLLVWGIRLLYRRMTAEGSGCREASRQAASGEAMDSRGWLLLAVPCPVCAAAIFLVCAFARLLLPEWHGGLRWAVPGFFLLANGLCLGGLLLAGRIGRLAPLRLTGRLMIGIALYFLLILLLAPRFQEAGKLYATARSGDFATSFGMRGWICLVLLSTAAAVGFGMEKLKRKGR